MKWHWRDAALMACVALLTAGVVIPVHAAPVLLRVYFDLGSDQLDEAAVAKLDQVVPILQTEYRWQRIEVGGHTDTFGGSLTNRGLSRRRAQAVFDYLAAQGMSMDRSTVRAYGETQPRADEYDESGRAQNRRVELRLLDNPEPGNLSFPAE